MNCNIKGCIQRYKSRFELIPNRADQLVSMVVEATVSFDNAIEIDRIVFGVVRQQPPTMQAPASLHFSTYDTKSSSETPVDSCQFFRNIWIIPVIRQADDPFLFNISYCKKAADYRSSYIYISLLLDKRLYSHSQNFDVLKFLCKQHDCCEVRVRSH